MYSRTGCRLLSRCLLGRLVLERRRIAELHTIYLTDNGLVLKKKSERIVVKKDGAVVEEIPIRDLKRILIFGNNQLSSDLMRHLASRGIEVAFLSSSGRFRYRIVPETSKNIYLRMAQHDRHRNAAFRLHFSRTVVEAKLKNQRTLLVRYQRYRPEVDMQKTLDTLKNSAAQVHQQNTVEEIMGVEGFGAKSYFDAYGKLFLNDFKFAGRQYHPAPDPINALLSLGYMMLFHELNSLLEACGFDVFLGFLHSIKYGRASLPIDVMEELRSPVVDRMVLYLANKGVIKPTQFTEREKKGVFLEPPALKTFLGNYEKFMTAPFIDPASRQSTSYREIVKRRVTVLERTLLNNADYEPYLFY
jgi:CRISPR-associated protein Cas1